MSAVPSASVDAAAAERNENGSANGSGSGRREGSSNTNGNAEQQRPSSPRRTLDEVMREPSRTVPDVVVLDSLPEPDRRKDVLDPKEDLWLSTVDGRYSSLIVPIHVGEAPYAETFYVHKHVLLKSEYFKKALCGDFKESGTQSIDLPEEDPAIFHFLVAYLYEGRYEPIKPAASVLLPDQDKDEAAVAGGTGADSDSESTSSLDSDISAHSRRRRERRRRREERNRERMRQKHPGLHRPNCNCPQCATASGPPCWSCRAPRNPPPYPPAYIPHDPLGRPDRQPPRPPRRRTNHAGPPPPQPLTPPLPGAGGGGGGGRGPGTTAAGSPTTTTTPGPPPDPNGGRISGEDLRTWLLAYELNIDVYILANKFLLDGFKKEIARAAVDMLETAGSDAAVVEVLYLCRKLYDGLPESDPLLKMVFARVGFLQPWRRAERETNAFLVGNPEIAPLLLREMAARREEDVNGRALPSMVRPWFAGGVGGGGPTGDQFGGGGPWRGYHGGVYHGWPVGPGPGPGHPVRRVW